MIKNPFFILTIAILGAGCSGKSISTQDLGKSVQLTGAIEFPQGDFITLEEFAQESNQYVVYDTIPVRDDSTFERTIYFTNPGYFRLNFFNKQLVTLILDEDDIHIVADGSRPTGQVKITGSTEVDQLSALSNVLKEINVREQEFQKQYAQAVSDQDKDLAEQLTGDFMSLQDEKNEAIKNEIKKMGVSLAALQAINLLDKDKEYTFVADVSSKLLAKYPNVGFVKMLADEIERMKKVAIGQMAPEIALPNPEGEVIKLSSLRGKYVLVDFWAEWCRPCRLENPNVLRAYNRFKDKGFEVYGVSLDRTREKWLKGIQEDGLPWTHVSDLSYFNSEAVRDYNINAIPFSVLLDKEGKIIDKNLRGQDLHRKLEEIFGNPDGAGN